MPTHKPNDPKGAAGSVKTPLGLIPPSAMEEIAWVHKLGADKYGKKVPVYACSVGEELEEFCTCGYSIPNQYVTQTDHTPPEECVLSATTRNTQRQNELLATLAESLGLEGYVSPVTTSTLEKLIQSTDFDRSQQLTHGLKPTKNMREHKHLNETSCLKRESEIGPETENALLRLLDLLSTMKQSYLESKTLDAQYAEDQQDGEVFSTSTTTTKRASSEVSSAIGATKDLACSETILNLLKEHSPTCEVHRLIIRDGEVERYGSFNWRRTGVCASTYVHAILRHLNAWRNGEDADPESGRSHIAHVACCCNILLDAAACGTLDDDRDKMPEHVEATFNKFVDDEPESCECGRYKINHFMYGLICEDCDLHPEY